MRSGSFVTVPGSAGEIDARSSQGGTAAGPMKGLASSPQTCAALHWTIALGIWVSHRHGTDARRDNREADRTTARWSGSISPLGHLRFGQTLRPRFRRHGCRYEPRLPGVSEAHVQARLTAAMGLLTAVLILSNGPPVSASSGAELAPGGPSGSYLVPVGIHKIKHVIIIEQENRSFDSYFGTFPDALGIPMKNGVPTVCIPNPAPKGCTRPYHDKADVNGGGPHGENDALAATARPASHPGARPLAGGWIVSMFARCAPGPKRRPSSSSTFRLCRTRLGPTRVSVPTAKSRGFVRRLRHRR